jgi:hypothetical protein
VNPPPCLTSRLGYDEWRDAFDHAYAMHSSSRRYVGKDDEGVWVVAFLFHMVVLDGDE